jgi:hypothetical protein
MGAKRYLLIAFAIVGGLVAISAAASVTLIVLASRTLTAQKPDITQLTYKFTSCLYSRNRECLRSMTSWNDQNLDLALGLAVKLQERLGARKHGAALQDTWNVSSSFGSASNRSGIVTKITVRFAVVELIRFPGHLPKAVKSRSSENGFT